MKWTIHLNKGQEARIRIQREGTYQFIGPGSIVWEPKEAASEKVNMADSPTEGMDRSLVQTLKALCEQNCTSIPELEKELGFGKGAIYNWDTNHPSVYKVQKVAQRFAVSIDSLLLGPGHYPYCDQYFIKRDMGTTKGKSLAQHFLSVMMTRGMTVNAIRNVLAEIETEIGRSTIKSDWFS